MSDFYSTINKTDSIVFFNACRVIGTNKYNRFLSCALDGAINAHAHTYVSKRGFSIGQWKTWYMRDMDGDGRDDYCR